MPVSDYGRFRPVARWQNGVLFTPDEARRLGMRLMAQADAAEEVAEFDWEGA